MGFFNLKIVNYDNSILFKSIFAKIMCSHTLKYVLFLFKILWKIIIVSLYCVLVGAFRLVIKDIITVVVHNIMEVTNCKKKP